MTIFSFTCSSDFEFFENNIMYYMYLLYPISYRYYTYATLWKVSTCRFVCRTLEAWFPGCCFIVQLWVFILVESLPELQRAGLGWGLGWAGAEEQTLIESFSKLWLRILRIPSPHNQGEGERMPEHLQYFIICRYLSAKQTFILP